MQATVGTILFVVVCSAATYWSADYYKKSNNLWGSFFTFVTVIVVTYVALGLLFGVLWVLAKIGIYLREITLWIYEAILFPFSWIF